MAAMIQNDEEKEWMLPLLDLRNELDVMNDKPLRDFRRMSGGITLFHDAPVHGPYTQSAREHWLTRVLEAQTWIREHAPEGIGDIELISMPELHEIRRIWVFEKHEIEDSVPRIYETVTGGAFPGRPLDEHLALGAEDIDLLRELCGDDDLHFEMTRALIGVERRFRTMARRAGLFEELETAVRRSFYEGKDDAVDRARQLSDARALSKGLSLTSDVATADQLAISDSVQITVDDLEGVIVDATD